MYSNLFDYRLYIGICLLLMLVYSLLYFLLAIYVERINPGEFGVSQPWNYLFKKSYWKPELTSSVQPFNSHDIKNDGIYGSNNWIELNSMTNSTIPSITITHLTKVRYSIFRIQMFIYYTFIEIWKNCGHIRFILKLL